VATLRQQHEQVDRGGIAPVQVLEHEHERALLGERLEEAPPGGERLAATVAAEPRVGFHSDEGAEVQFDPAGVTLVVDGGIDGLAKLLGSLGLGVPLVDASLRLDDLSQRPEGDAVTVGEAAALAPRDDVRVGIDDLG